MKRKENKSLCRNVFREKQPKILSELTPQATSLNNSKGTLIDGDRTTEELSGYKRGELARRKEMNQESRPAKFTEVLIVEDDPISSKLLETALSSCDSDAFNVKSSSTLETAFWLLDENCFDVVLLDLNLPDSAGLDTLNKMIEKCPDAAIVVITGAYGEETGLQAVASGVQEYLVKGKYDVYTLKKSIHYAVERKRTEERIKQQQKMLKKFSRKILSIREEEKKKLSTNLHDEVGSMAVALSSNLAIAGEKIKDNNLRGALRSICQARKTLKGSIESFKNIAADLRPPDLDIIGLPGASKAYFSKIAKQAKVKIDFCADKNIKIVNDKTAIVLYRIVQEALNNIVKHAKARNVKIRMYSQENNLKFNICDDGKGFDIKRSLEKTKVLKMGILGMKERVEFLDGVFIIESVPKKGTKIFITIPNNHKGE